MHVFGNERCRPHRRLGDNDLQQRAKQLTSPLVLGDQGSFLRNAEQLADRPRDLRTGEAESGELRLELCTPPAPLTVGRKPQPAHEPADHRKEGAVAMLRRAAHGGQLTHVGAALSKRPHQTRLSDAGFSADQHRAAGPGAGRAWPLQQPRCFFGSADQRNVGRGLKRIVGRDLGADGVHFDAVRHPFGLLDAE